MITKKYMEMKNILKKIVFPVISMGILFSCADRYEIDSQTGKFEKSLTVVSDSVYYFEATSPREVVMSINASSAWQCISSEDWCSVDPASSDISSLIEEITLSIEENTESFGERTAILTFSAQGIAEEKKIEIVQYGLSRLEVGEIEVIAEEGGTKSFTVLSNRDFTITTSADWLNISPLNGTPSDQEQTISVTASSNAGQEKRSAVVLIKTNDQQKELVVNQAGISFEIDGEKTVYVPKTESNLEVNLVTTSSWSVNIPQASDWITADVNSGAGDGTITFTVGENPGIFQRRSYVYFETPLASLKDSILIIQQADAIPFTAEYFVGVPANSVTFNEDGSATLYAGPGTGSKVLKSTLSEFSYGKYTVHFSDIVIPYTSGTMLMSITTPDKTFGGISWGAFAKEAYTDSWASEYWISDAFGSKIRQRFDNDVLREDIEKYVIDVRKSETEGKVDIDFYINDILLKSEQGNDGFASGDPMILSFWIYNFYDKVNPAVFEPISLIYEPY
jgi:hypothetical protein